METKHVTCTVCDGACVLDLEVENGQIKSMKGHGDPKTICYKAFCWDEYTKHPDRLLHPLRRVGERGSGKWEQVSWDTAFFEIAARTQAAIDEYGPETVAFSAQPVNLSKDHGMIRRFLSVIGSPNYISGLHMCVGNTVHVHRATFGTWYTSLWDKANCIVFVGHNPHQDCWVGEYRKLLAARERGAKLIVLDPRVSQNAAIADIHLPLRPGTDAAMLLGWINVIIEEGLYDEEFVEKYTYGLDELRKRAAEYPLSRVAEITGCAQEDIAAAARMYATNGPSIIPWGPIPDMQVNGTSAIRCEGILMALCGWLGKSEMLLCPNPDVVSISEIEMLAELPEEQKRKQIGSDKYPLLSFAGYEPLREANKRIYGIEWRDEVASFMANPALTFKAMRTGEPYHVKVLFNFGSNALIGYVGQQNVLEGLMNLDLLVVFDHWMTPTAQLADFVLPGDYYLERPALGCADAAPFISTSQKVLEAPGECKNCYDVIHGIAEHMGLGEYFPWASVEELFDYRLAPLGVTWKDIEQEYAIAPSSIINYFDPEVGFATPTGKIELYSKQFEALGLDPLPYYREPAQSRVGNPELAREYPLELFAGVRDPGNYLTNLHQIPSLRKHSQNPEAFLNPADGIVYGVMDGEWCWVETVQGRMKALAKWDDAQPQGVVRVPHGWWMPELEPGLEAGLSGAMVYNDSLLIPDDEWNTDPEQGIPNLRGGILAKVYAAE